MKRKHAWALAFLLALTALTACGASSAPSSPGESAATAEAQWNSLEDSFSPAVIEEPYGGGNSAQSGAAREAAGGKKRIYSAELNLETTAFDGAAAGLDALVNEMGGWMERSSVNYGGDGYRCADYTVRVPQEKFEAFLDQAGTLCRETSRFTAVEDVTEYYYDAAGRLKTQQTKLERLQTLLSKAESMEDIITIESAVSETEQAVEALSGELRHYDAQIDYARVELSVREVYQLSNIEQPAATFSSRLGAAMASGWHGFLAFLKSALVFLAYAWVPVLAAVLALAGVLVYRRRRKAAKKAAQPPASPLPGLEGLNGAGDAPEKNTDDKSEKS